MEFDEKFYVEHFGDPGRHQTWKSVYHAAKSLMEQMYLPMDDSWATLRIMLQKLGNAQGWAGNADNPIMCQPRDRHNAITNPPVKPAKVKTKQRSGYCHNDEVSPNGRLMFQKEGIEYHPRTLPAEQKTPMYYIEPDNFQSESEAKGVLIMAFASVIIDLDHMLINEGKHNNVKAIMLSLNENIQIIQYY